MREKRGLSELQNNLKWMNVYVAGVPQEEDMEQKKHLKIYHDHDFSKFVKNC